MLILGSGQPQPGVGLAPCFHDSAITRAAERTRSSPATVTFSWLVQRGIAVIPKSETPSRIRSNLQLARLTDEEMAEISAIAEKPGMHRSLLAEGIFGTSGKLWGWTTEDLGFAFDHTGVVGGL
jgi:diketogulonate reductase-like aldo/keto reductase